MYWGNGYGMGWLGLLIGLVMMLVFWGGLITLAVLVVRALRDGRGAGRHGAHAESTSAEGILAERFARGELDEQAYRHQREVLRSN